MRNMQQLEILNTREVKLIKDALMEQFGYFPEEDFAYLMNDKKRVFIVNKDIGKIELKNLIIDRIGLYFGEIMNDKSFRLSKEGAQLLDREAKENRKKLDNTVDLTEKELKDYFQGQDLEKDLGGKNRLVLLYFNRDIIGCAKYKEGKILNFLPKIHRGEVIV
ncbi:hypothetical protein HYX12_01615 [Candidatus Woesearchaeota archaeon]|nr:hypothetical protein [Candidatus Woesearchaeota archaeon]